MEKAGFVMASNDWLIDVLEDIRHFADENGLGMTVEALEAALTVLSAELPQILDADQALGDPRLDGLSTRRLN